MKLEDIYIERKHNGFSQFFGVVMLLVALFYSIKVDMPNMESVWLYFAVYMIFAPGGRTLCTVVASKRNCPRRTAKQR